MLNSQEEIETFIVNQKSANSTKKKNTISDRNTLKLYLKSIGKKGVCIESEPAEKLDNTLAKCFMNGKKKDGKTYCEPDKMSSFRRRFQRHLNEYCNNTFFFYLCIFELCHYIIFIIEQIKSLRISW